MLANENVAQSSLEGTDKDKSIHNRSFDNDLLSQRSQLFDAPPRTELAREQLLKRREKNDANLRLTNFKKSFTQSNGLSTYNEKIKLLP